METLSPSSNRYIGRYPGTVPPKYSLGVVEQFAPLTEKKNILIVDDDVFFRSLLKVMLGQTGWSFDEVWEAEDSRTALEICRSRPVDLVFCDLTLPAAGSANGLEIIAELRQFRPDTPVFLVTADNNENLVLKICALGATGHLLKPISLRTLKRTLVMSFAPNSEYGSS
jgi:CheY-like chemotaxis protein